MADVHVIFAGGTISMDGELASPNRGLPAMLAAKLDDGVTYEIMSTKPSPHLSGDDSLAIVRRAASWTATGRSVVVSHGTDTLEETAFLGALLNTGPGVVVFTGAMRPNSSPGSDGLANLSDAIQVARAETTRGCRAVVTFAGHIFDAYLVRKVDSYILDAFEASTTGPIGRVVEGRVTMHSQPVTRPTFAPTTMSRRVAIATLGLGSDGTEIENLSSCVDGMIVALPGGGHLAPPALDALRNAAQRLPVVATSRTLRGPLLSNSYAYPGSERDVRGAATACAGGLSPVAARIKLLVCLGSRMDQVQIASAFAIDDL